ncbi:MAG: hypothetical protein DRP23_01080 [Thermotogae bacterium]|nr:MAG: hypothetical protein DRP23_01080 [Thermotogota bacterium]
MVVIMRQLLVILNNFVPKAFRQFFYFVTVISATIYAGLEHSGSLQLMAYLDVPSSDLSLYYQTVPPKIMEEYTKCEAEYDCDSPIIQEAVKEIDESCEDRTLKGWINCAVEYINSKITYDRSGGINQCGDTASEALKYGKGNCVDYATIFVALARAKKIPSYTGAVCLTSKSGYVECDLYQTIRPIEYTRLSGIVPKGHAVALVYVDGNWTIVDPTFEYGLTRRCYGYSPILERGEHYSVCKVPFYKIIGIC